MLCHRVSLWCLAPILVVAGCRDRGGQGASSADQRRASAGAGSRRGVAKAASEAQRQAWARDCASRTGHSAASLDSRRVACRALCDLGSRQHCERLAGVCLSGIPGGTLCPAESVWANERACDLGAAASCEAAAEAHQRGGPHGPMNLARADALRSKACRLEPKRCFSVAPADAQAALRALSVVAVPGGTFRPGFRPYDTAEKPRDYRLPPVTLGAFDIDRTEVTVGAYAACVNAGRCKAPSRWGECNWGKPDRLGHPVNCVAASEAAAFCAWRGRRLPSQDEWELAARGVDDRPYPWGQASPGNQLCWRRERTCPVGAYPAGASPYGALDLEGNVEEWTTSSAYVTNVATFYDATVSRGSSFADTSTFRMGLNNQHYHRPSDVSPSVGFRCVSRARATAPADAPTPPAPRR